MTVTAADEVLLDTTSVADASPRLSRGRGIRQAGSVCVAVAALAAERTFFDELNNCIARLVGRLGGVRALLGT